MKRTDDVDTSTIAVVGIIGAIFLFVVIVGILAWFQGQQKQELQRKVITQKSERLSQVQSGQLERINGYRMIDVANNVVAVPIDRSMQIMVKEISTSATLSQKGGRDREKERDD